MLARHVARIEMDLGDARVVARDEPVQDLCEETPLFHAETAHDAEIDRDDTAFGIHEKISLVHVGVEIAVAQRMPQEALHQVRPESFQIVAGGFELADLADGNAVDPFEREHAPRAARPIDHGHAEAFVVLGVFRHL